MHGGVLNEREDGDLRGWVSCDCHNRGLLTAPTLWVLCSVEPSEVSEHRGTGAATGAVALVDLLELSGDAC